MHDAAKSPRGAFAREVPRWQIVVTVECNLAFFQALHMGFEEASPRWTRVGRRGTRNATKTDTKHYPKRPDTSAAIAMLRHVETTRCDVLFWIIMTQDPPKAMLVRSAATDSCVTHA